MPGIDHHMYVEVSLKSAPREAVPIIVAKFVEKHCQTGRRSEGMRERTGQLRNSLSHFKGRAAKHREKRCF